MIYEESSGPLADRYTQRTTISRAGVQFERTGDEGGRVNRGQWAVEAPRESIEALFELLGALDCRAIKEVRPASPPDGGGARLYTIEYERGGALQLWYREGVWYEGAEPVTAPIQDVIRALTLPPDASSVYLYP